MSAQVSLTGVERTRYARAEFFSVCPLADIRAPWREGNSPCEQCVLGSVAPFEPSVLIVRLSHSIHCVGIAKDHLQPHDEARAALGIRLINQAVASEQAS